MEAVVSYDHNAEKTMDEFMAVFPLHEAFEDITIHPNGSLETKPWGMKEFSLLDPNGTLLTFGEKI